MTSSAEVLLPPTVRARRGRWSAWRAAPAVTASDIRRWAIAVYWPEPPPRRFVDEEAAFSRWGGLVAPQELNPFAWLPASASVAATIDAGDAGDGDAPPDEHVPARRLFGGCRIEFGAPIRVGDVVRRRVRLDGWTPKVGASGDMLLVDHTHEWRNQRDEVVRSAVYTLIHQAR